MFSHFACLDGCFGLLTVLLSIVASQKQLPFLAAKHGAIYPCFCVSPNQWLSVPLAPSNCSGSMSLADWHLLFATAWPTWHLTSEILELTLSSASACCPFFSLLGDDIYQLLGLAHACVRSFRTIAVIYRASRACLFTFVRV